jgi:hypothetical protein
MKYPKGVEELRVPRFQQVLADNAELNRLADSPPDARVDPVIAGGGPIAIVCQRSDMAEGGIPIDMARQVQE